MQIFDKVYKFKIIEIKDHDLIDILNVDLNVDFNNKFLKEEEINYPDFVQEIDFVHDTEQIFNEKKSENIQVEPIVLPDRDKLREARLKFYTKKEGVIQVPELTQIKEKELPKTLEKPEQPSEKLEEPIPSIKIKRKYTKKKKI